MSSMGLCSLCQTKSVAVWITDPCKHEACRKCLMSRTNFKTCFACRKQVEFFRCPGSQYGCRFNVTQGKWREHEVNCMFLPVECPYQCGAIIPKKILSRHINSECPLRQATCQYCHDSVFQVEHDHHERSCPEAPISCSFCHEGNIKRGRLPQHAKTCEKTPKPCPLNKYGCGFVGLDGVMDEHLNVKNHVSCLQKVNKDLEERDTEIARLRNCVDTLKNEMRESLADGIVPFDKELKWTVMGPDVSNARGSHSYSGSSSSIRPCALRSPIYKHRSTNTSFCFTLRIFVSYCNSITCHMTLRQHLLAEGDSSQSEKFIVKVEKTMSGNAPTEVARKEGIVCKDQDLLSLTHGNDTFYIVTFVHADDINSSTTPLFNTATNVTFQQFLNRIKFI